MSDPIEEVYQLLTLLITLLLVAKQYKQWNHYLVIVRFVDFCFYTELLVFFNRKMGQNNR